MDVVRLSALRNSRLYPRGNIPGTNLLEAESIPGAQCGRKERVNEKFQ